jgi:hypothetical protein
MIGEAGEATHWYQDFAALTQMVCHFIAQSAIKPDMTANISKVNG